MRNTIQLAGNKLILQEKIVYKNQLHILETLDKMKNIAVPYSYLTVVSYLETFNYCKKT